jgi:diphosphomevalonate decarboxylase
MSLIACCEAHPSLALIKYWGKLSGSENLPATTSIAVTLGELTSTAEISLGKEDSVVLNGKPQDPERYTDFFSAVRNETGFKGKFQAVCSNSFPTAAGLASSSSGFAALAGACLHLTGRNLDNEKISAIARIGSGSASRSVFGGFTRLSEGSDTAEALFDENYWPDFKVIIVTVSESAKEISSRKAMESSRMTSPFYESWVESSRELAGLAAGFLAQRNLSLLGPCIRQSYLRMFSTMFTAEPPLIFWKPESLAVIKFCEHIRESGIGAWETMDAGPQVKIFCLSQDSKKIIEGLRNAIPDISVLEASPGPGIKVWSRTS